MLNKLWTINIFLSLTFLYSSSYMGEIQPYNKVIVLSETVGLIVFINPRAEFSYIKNEKILSVENSLEKIQLAGFRNKLSLLEKIYSLKSINYERKNRAKQISDYEKNIEKNLVLEVENNILTLKNDIKVLKYKNKKKFFWIKNKYVGKIFIREGDYVSVGTKIMEIYDISKLKIELFVRANEIKELRKKTIFINGEKTKFKIERIAQVRDSTHISSFLVRIVKKNISTQRFFGNIVNVEFK